MIPRLDIVSPRFCEFFAAHDNPRETENPYVYRLNHSRAGIYLALKAIGIHAGDKVGMMVYNCHTVMNAIAQTGAVIVFIDVTEDLRMDITDLQRKSKDMKALVVTHLFGRMNDMARIHSLVPDIPVIEDCAHAYAQVAPSLIHPTYHTPSSPVEHGTAFYTFSIGQGKYPSLGDGGLLVVPSKNGKIDEMYRRLPAYTKSQEIKLYLRLLLKGILYRPWIYTHFVHPLLNKRGIPAAKQTVTPMKMSRGVAYLYDAWRAKHPHIEHAEFMCVSYVDDPQAYIAQLQQQGIDAATHFKHCITWAKAFGYEETSCPVAEQLVNHLVMTRR